MPEKKCLFCGNTSIESKTIEQYEYYRCLSCFGIFIDPRHRLDPIAEKKRYELHDNSLENTGYCAYLEKFIDEVIHFPDIKSALTGLLDIQPRILDYGSGPKPALVRILSNKGYKARGWDPFFAPDTPLFTDGAHIVTCLEVAEHFSNPLESFTMIGKHLCPGGFLALGTHLLPVADHGAPLDEKTGMKSDWDAFKNWWYRRDPTHISFYTLESLRLVAAQAGFALLGTAGKQVFIFKYLK